MFDYSLLDIIILSPLIAIILVNIFLFHIDRKDRAKTEQTMQTMFKHLSVKNEL